MNKRLAKTLRSHAVLVVCEGVAEEVIFTRLLDAGKLLVPREGLLTDPASDKPLTYRKKPQEIVERFLQTDLSEFGGEDKLIILRLLDSQNERLVFPRSDRDRVEVVDVRTRPEIEMLAIHKCGAYDKWLTARKKDHNLKPSDFCKDTLHMPHVKNREFLEGFWGRAEDIAAAANTYREKLGKRKSKDYCLADILK